MSPGGGPDPWSRYHDLDLGSRTKGGNRRQFARRRDWFFTKIDKWAVVGDKQR